MADAARKMYFQPSAWSKRYGESFFTARVSGYTIHHEEGPWCCGPVEHAAFDIYCSAGERTWIVARRTKAFFDVWSRVRGGLRVDESTATLDAPVLPKKTPFGRDTSPAFLRQRELELAAFLNALLLQFNAMDDRDARNAVESFLEV